MSETRSKERRGVLWVSGWITAVLAVSGGGVGGAADRRGAGALGPAGGGAAGHGGSGVADHRGVAGTRGAPGGAAAGVAAVGGVRGVWPGGVHQAALRGAGGREYGP